MAPLASSRPAYRSTIGAWVTRTPGSTLWPTASNLYAGVTYNQFLGTVLQAMGMPPSEFERWGHKGYGYPLVTPPDYGILPFARHYQNTSSRYFEIASDVLPFVKA